MKNKFILALGFLSITFVNAQELNEDFLARLPDDIKEDLVKKNAGQGKSSEERYRPYLYSTKLSQAEELLKLKDRLEEDLLDLERRLKFDGSVDTDLKLYGSDFFNTFQTSFMPINEPNPDSGYTLDTGDVLNIQLTGQKMT